MSVNPEYTGPINTKNPIPDGESRITIYGYTPSLALAAVALGTFAVVTILHVLYIFKGRRATRTFQILMAFGCLMELVGYGFRLGSSKNPFKVINFILQYFMIVCAPVFFTTALYLSLVYAIRRLPQEVQRRVSPLGPKKMLWIFASIDVVTTALQICGAALIGVSESNRANNKTSPISTASANNILLAGLAIQNFSFLIFLALFAVIAMRNRKLLRNKAGNNVSYVGDDKAYKNNAGILENEEGILSKLPASYIWVTIISSLALFLRTLFRLAETADGVFGFASTTEAYFGVLEYAPVIVGIGLWAAFPLYKMLTPRRNASNI